jgi:hypothetical protein
VEGCVATLRRIVATEADRDPADPVRLEKLQSAKLDVRITCTDLDGTLPPCFETPLKLRKLRRQGDTPLLSPDPGGCFEGSGVSALSRFGHAGFRI